MALQRLDESGAFAVTVWIAVSEPIAADFHRSSTILAKTLPSGFVASDSCIFYWFNHFEKTKGLACKVVLDLELGTTARFGLTAAETVRKHRYDISALAFAEPLHFVRFCSGVFLYHCQLSEGFARQVNQRKGGLMPETATGFCAVGLGEIGGRNDNGISALTLTQPHWSAWFHIGNTLFDGQESE